MEIKDEHIKKIQTSAKQMQESSDMLKSTHLRITEMMDKVRASINSLKQVKPKSIKMLVQGSERNCTAEVHETIVMLKFQDNSTASKFMEELK